jgi:hypothetical protein
MSNLKHCRVKISDHAERVARYKVSAFRFEGGSWQELPKRQMPEGKVPLLLCSCGSGEFTENGRSMNEYECPCCGQFVELTLIA